MDCLLLAVWTLPAAILGGSSMQFQTLPWLGSAVKTLQLWCLCCISHAATLTSDSISELTHDYVFVTPVRVDASGSYISHDVLHSTRRKRSTQSSKSSLHYKFSAFGQELHLELKPSTILSNSFIVQVLGKDGVSNSQEHEIEQCFYQGFIRNDSTSSVAISTCVGLSGLIRTRQMEFLISPLPQQLAQEHNYTSPAGHHPHVLYKRTAEGKVHRSPAQPHPKSSPPGRRRTRASHAHPARASGYRHGRFQKQHFCGRRKKCIDATLKKNRK